ncbi:hypothetical protein BGZ51_005733 [Haplosporangium sp. Z 767]|nr:hypothetical protein BGZ51_005733 [Haplosporangium sp. Z 767]KAF9194908.1 hypothetical protein BGZ50_005541 [Haplosporangium sp. Z 11]
MIPTKRSSPFARARSFQNSQARNGQSSRGSESTPPFTKKPAFARSMSSPFQVLSPSLKTAKNPFEKLAPAIPTSDLVLSSAAVESVQLKEEEEEEEEDDQDEALDPSKTLQMFSFSQTVARRMSVSAPDEELPEDEEEHEQHQGAEQDSKDGNTDSIPDIQPIQSRKPRLHEALEMSLNLNRLRTTQEFQAPVPSNTAPKKLGTEWKTAETLPLDWTLKSSIIITSRDTLHGSVSKSGNLEATLTNSTPGLRKVLDDEEIKYERLPNLGGKTTVRNFSSKHDLQGFDDKESEARPEAATKSPFQIELKPELSDTLLFQGQVDVHGLFSYLLTLKTSYEDGFLYNSPNLIAGVPFLHAALKRAQLSKCKVVSKHIEDTETLQKEFRIEIDGVVLPTLVKELYNVFAKQQSLAGYTCVTSSDSRSNGLNLRPLLRNPDNDEDTFDASFVSPRALENVRYSPNEQQFSWLS